MNPYSISDNNKHKLLKYVTDYSQYFDRESISITLNYNLPTYVFESILPKVLINLIIDYVCGTINIICYIKNFKLFIQTDDVDIGINLIFIYNCDCKLSDICRCVLPYVNVPILQCEFECRLVSYCMSQLYNIGQTQDSIIPVKSKLYNINNFMNDKVSISNDEICNMNRVIKQVNYVNFYNEMLIFKLFYDILINHRIYTHKSIYSKKN